MSKIIAIFLTLILFFYSFIPVVQSPFLPQKAYAETCVYTKEGQANIQMLYQGQQQDPESNMYYLRARYYDPATGRFISRDPVKGYLQDPRTQNGYDYAINNPINLSDPSGENPLLQKCVEIGSNVVYQAVQNGAVKYIGITNDIARRSAEQLSSKGITIEAIKGLTNLNRFDARAIEQVLIEQNGLSNLITHLTHSSSELKFF